MRISNEITQICYLCHRTSEETAFYPNRARFNGYDSACIECKREIKRPYNGPSEARRRASKRYYLNHRDEILQQRRDRYATDPEYRQKAKDRVYHSRLRRKFNLVTP